MFPAIFATITAISMLGFGQLIPVNNTPVEKPLAAHTFSLEKRYSNSFVSDVFKDNILLSIEYMSGTVQNKQQVNWDAILKPFTYSFTLEPGKTFAFHDDILPQFQNSVVKTSNAHFNWDEGFKNDGYLTGDGVCHLASLMYWVAKDAGLTALAPVNHDFANIPEIDKKYGVAIYSSGVQDGAGKQQNLYITNNKEKPVMFTFVYNGKDLSFEAKEIH